MPKRAGNAKVTIQGIAHKDLKGPMCYLNTTAKKF